jgi:hypothetical protein
MRLCDYVATVNWQQLLSLSIVAITAGLFVHARWRRRKFSFARDTHCGCAAPRAGATPPSITFHARKGQRAEVTVRLK